MDLDNFARSYIVLGLRINHHINGYVEHFYGPLELKEIIDAEGKVPTRNLLDDCTNLLGLIKDQGFNEKRQAFLEKTLHAVYTLLRKLNGENIPYLELVENLYDFKPKLYEDKFFYDLSSKAEYFYQGKGSLATRIKNYARRRTIPVKNVKNQFLKALDIARKQTNKIFPEVLPDYERIKVVEVKDQTWPFYCWYLGNYQSRIEVNISRNHYWTQLLDIACHEGYPGHHMERLIKEQLLYHDKGYFESSILQIYTPEMVISEGIGTLAERVIFDRTESSEILLDFFLPNLKKEDSLEVLVAQSEIREGFKRFEGNLAYLKYVNELSDDKLIKYARSFEVIPDEGIEAMMAFISDEIWAPYILVYQGERLITDSLGNKPSPRNFLKLLSEQTLPSDL